MRTCTACRQTKPVTEFQRSKTGYKPACRGCRRVRDQIRRRGQPRPDDGVWLVSLAEQAFARGRLPDEIAGDLNCTLDFVDRVADRMDAAAYGPAEVPRS